MNDNERALWAPRRRGRIRPGGVVLSLTDRLPAPTPAKMDASIAVTLVVDAPLHLSHLQEWMMSLALMTGGVSVAHGIPIRNRRLGAERRGIRGAHQESTDTAIGQLESIGREPAAWFAARTTRGAPLESYTYWLTSHSAMRDVNPRAIGWTVESLSLCPLSIGVLAPSLPEAAHLEKLIEGAKALADHDWALQNLLDVLEELSSKRRAPVRDAIRGLLRLGVSSLVQATRRSGAGNVSVQVASVASTAILSSAP